MQAVVKMPRINFRIDGDIPQDLLSFLQEKYGKGLELIENSDEEYVDVVETDWYRNTKAQMSPGKYMCIYRENLGLTQKELGEKLGNITAQNISHYENNRRAISKNLAKKLSTIFNVSVERFL